MTFRLLTVALIVFATGGCGSSGNHAGSPADQQSAAAGLPPDSFIRPKDHRQLRAKIAEQVESSTAYRTLIDGGAPKLKDARIAGPFDISHLIQGRGVFYCVSAEIEQPLSALIREVRTSSFKVQALADGTEFLQPDGLGLNGQRPGECEQGKFEPFPELEQARNKRRLALGKSA